MRNIFLRIPEEISEKHVKEILEERGFRVVDSEPESQIVLRAEPDGPEGNGYALKIEDGRIRLGYGSLIGFFRGLGTALARLEAGVALAEEEELSTPGAGGVMYDCSRNGVMRTETIRRYIRQQALLGLERVFLYTEDTYEVEEYPYFGAMRGRYTEQEIRECDDYAAGFGIEMIPCIQTLAHLRTALRWPAMRKFRDHEDILIAEEEETYRLIDAMLRSVSRMYRSRRIHLGMDEAFYLGYGNYRKKHGLTGQGELIKRHLDRVMELCRKYNLEPMIWSDMFFVTPGGGDYYGVPEEYEWPAEEKPEKGITLVYWDYYSHDPGRYSRMAGLHKKLTGQVCFAGGGWIWNGLAPDYDKAMDATRCAFAGMEGMGVTDSMLTLWLDNGAETPMMTGIPMMIYYAGRLGQKEWDEEELEVRMRSVAGGSWKDMLLLDRFDHVPGTGACNENNANPCKGIFYQDPLLGIFDRQYGTAGLDSYYDGLAEELKEAGKRADGQTLLYGYYETLARILAGKSTLGFRIWNAYRSGDKETLRSIADQELPRLAALTEELKNRREQIWMQEYKANGFEVLDIRFAGVAARLRSAAGRLELWLEGRTEKLDELEEDRLLYDPDERIAFCNLWEEIASPSNISGV